MAASFGNPEVRRAAGEALPRVARIGTHLLHFVSFVNDMRGWGRSIKRAVGRWYTEQELDRLTRQVLKYRQRDGWSHRDVLRLTHPKNAPGARLNDLMKWITHPDTAPVDPDRLPMVDAFHRLLHAGTATEGREAAERTRVAVAGDGADPASVSQGGLGRRCFRTCR